MSKVEPVYAMVVTPHADDAEFGVAGTGARWTREGKDVVYVVCTNGDKGSSDPNMKPKELAKIREEEQLAAAKLLGVREVIFLRHPDLHCFVTNNMSMALICQSPSRSPVVVLDMRVAHRNPQNPRLSALAWVSIRKEAILALSFSPIGFIQPAPSHEAKQGVFEAILTPKPAYVPGLIWEMQVQSFIV